MSEFEKMLSSGVADTNASGENESNNTKYVKLTYTKSGTVVLSATNNKEEAISPSKLRKFIGVN